MTEQTLKLLSKLSVLVAEDDEVSKNAVIMGLKPYCLKVVGVSDGYDGLEAFSRENFDIVLSDIHMPNLNGFEMMKRIREIKPHQKFIFFTSHDTDANFLKSIEAGASLFLKKPVDIKELRRMMLSIALRNDDKLIKISDEISINLEKERIYKNGTEIYLTYLQNKLFWLLAYNANKLVSYEMIEEFVYENEPTKKSAIQNAILRLKKELNIKLKNVFESGYVLSTDA